MRAEGPSAVSRAIGERVAALVPEGATLQLGIGAVPDASFQHSFIVSEQGTAAIWGQDATSQAQQIVDRVAHPEARESLREAGRELGFPLR